MRRFRTIIFELFRKRYNKGNTYYQVKPGEWVNLKRFMSLQLESQVMKNLAKQFSYDSWECDYRVIQILRWVHSNITYTSDDQLWGIPEYWEDAETILKNHKSDCEGGAMLIVTLARLAGVPADRIYLKTGWVNYNNKNVGHAYVSYLSDNGLEYYLDWCYFYDSRLIRSRPFAYEQTKYDAMWFMVNDKFNLVM